MQAPAYIRKDIVSSYRALTLDPLVSVKPPFEVLDFSAQSFGIIPGSLDLQFFVDKRVFQSTEVFCYASAIAQIWILLEAED